VTATAVVYIFRADPWVYTGKHAPAGLDACSWPLRGSGPLPSGYKGSGKAWRNAARKHGIAEWRILWRGPVSRVNAQEVRAVRLVRHVFGERCLNIYEGRDGLSGDDARRLWADPEYRARISVARQDPHYLERVSTAIKAQWEDPDYRANMLETLLSPEHQARAAAAARAACQTPEFREKMRRVRNDPDNIERQRASILATREAQTRAFIAEHGPAQPLELPLLAVQPRYARRLNRLAASFGDRPFTIAEAAQALGEPAGKMHRPLQTGIEHGVVERLAHHVYRFTPQPTQGDRTEALGAAAE